MIWYLFRGAGIVNESQPSWPSDDDKRTGSDNGTAESESDVESEDGAAWDSTSDLIPDESSAGEEFDESGEVAIAEDSSPTVPTDSYPLANDPTSPAIAENALPVSAPTTGANSRYSTRKRRRATPAPAENTTVCADPGCFILEDCAVGTNSVKCDGPHCDQVVSSRDFGRTKR